MIGSLDDLVRLNLASAPTLRAWLRDMPEDTPWLRKRGSKGDAYEVDLDEAASAWRLREEERVAAERRRSEDIRQMGLELGLGDREDHAVGLSIAERKQLLEEEVLANKLARQRGELVSRASMESAIADLLTKFRQRLGTFSARLAKKVDLERHHIVAIDGQMDVDLNFLADELERVEFGEGDGSDGEGDNTAAAALEA